MTRQPSPTGSRPQTTEGSHIGRIGAASGTEAIQSAASIAAALRAQAVVEKITERGMPLRA